MDKEDLDKEIEEIDSMLEQRMFIKTVRTYQCVKCGIKFDDIEEAFTHSLSFKHRGF